MAFVDDNVMDKLVFVASPYRAETQEGVEKNLAFALSFMKKLWEMKREVGIAPHCYFPQFLEESDDLCRKAGIDCGLEIMKLCSKMYVVGEIISKGMEIEIDVAKSLSMPIIYAEDPNKFFATKQSHGTTSESQSL